MRLSLLTWEGGVNLSLSNELVWPWTVCVEKGLDIIIHSKHRRLKVVTFTLAHIELERGWWLESTRLYQISFESKGSACSLGYVVYIVDIGPNRRTEIKLTPNSATDLSGKQRSEPRENRTQNCVKGSEQESTELCPTQTAIPWRDLQISSPSDKIQLRISLQITFCSETVDSETHGFAPVR